MKKLLFSICFLMGAQYAFSDVGDVTVINTISPQNNAFQYVVRSTNVFVSTTPFSKNLGPTDVNLQHALQTIDQLTVSGGSSASALAVGTGTVSNFTNNITSPTAVISALGAQFLLTTSGTTSFWQLNGASVTLQGQNVLTLSSASATYLQIGSSGTFLSVSSATANFLTQSSATATYLQIGSSGTFLSISSASANFLTQSSATLTYLNKNSIYVSSINVTNALTVTGNGTVGSVPIVGVNFSSVASISSLPTPGGVNTNVQSKQAGAFYGDSGFQYDNSVSSVTLTGKIGVADQGNLIQVGDGTSNPDVILNNQTGTPSGGLYFQSFGVNKANFSQSTGQVVIAVSSANTVAPTTRINFPEGSQDVQFTNPSSVVYIDFNPIGNSTFSIPVVISTLTIRNRIIDSAGSVGTNNQVFTSNGSVDTWQTPSGGSGSSTLAVGTGTASNFTNQVTSPTATISFDGSQFHSTALGTTNYLTIFALPAATISAGSLGSSVLTSSFPATSVSAGSYTNTNLTVNAQGQITSASNGSGGTGGTPGGSDTQVQFNQGGNFAGSSNLTYNTTSNFLLSGATSQFSNSIYISTNSTPPTATMLGNQLNVNTPSTPVKAAVVIASTVATQTPLSIQTFPGQSADTLDIATSAGTKTFSVNSSGSISTFGGNASASLSSSILNLVGSGLAVAVKNNSVSANSGLSLQSGTGSGSSVVIGAGSTAGGVFQETVTVNGVTISTLTVTGFSTSMPVCTDSNGNLTTSGCAAIAMSTPVISSMFFNNVFGAAQSKLPGSNAPFISNSTNETSAGIYFDDTSTQSVSWSFPMVNWSGGKLSADILFTSTATTGTMDWGVYTDTTSPGGSDNYDTPTYTVVVTTSVTMNSASNALQKATIALSNTVVVSSQNILTVKLEREAGSLDTATGFGRVKFLRVYESTGAPAASGPGGSGGGSGLAILPLPTGDTNYIQNSSFIQANSTASPQYLNVGSTSTFFGEVQIQNRLRIYSDIVDSALQAGTSGQFMTSLGSGNPWAWETPTQFGLLAGTQTWSGKNIFDTEAGGIQVAFTGNGLVDFFGSTVRIRDAFGSGGTPGFAFGSDGTEMVYFSVPQLTSTQTWSGINTYHTDTGGIQVAYTGNGLVDFFGSDVRVRDFFGSGGTTNYCLGSNGTSMVYVPTGDSIFPATGTAILSSGLIATTGIFTGTVSVSPSNISQASDNRSVLKLNNRTSAASDSLERFQIGDSSTPMFMGLQQIATTNYFIVTGSTVDGSASYGPAASVPFSINLATASSQYGNTQINGTLTVVTTSTQSSTINNGLVVLGRVVTSTATPIISLCGSTPSGSVVGNDNDGKITIGGGVQTACTMTFGGPPWANPPACVFTSNVAVTALTGATTTTVLTLGAGATFNGDIIMYHCGGYQ